MAVFDPSIGEEAGGDFVPVAHALLLPQQRQVRVSLGEHLTGRRSHWVPRQEVAVGWCPEGG
jgi:hypothetical protein